MLKPPPRHAFNGGADDVPNHALELLPLDPDESLLSEEILQHLVEDQQCVLEAAAREDSFREGHESADADVLDDGAGLAALEAYREYPDEEGVAGESEDGGVDEAVSSLDDPQGGFGLLVAALEEGEDVDD